MQEYLYYYYCTIYKSNKFIYVIIKTPFFFLWCYVNFLCTLNIFTIYFIMKQNFYVLQ